MKPKKISNRIIIGFAAFIVIGLILGVVFQPRQVNEKEYQITSVLPELLSDTSITQLKITGYNQLAIHKNDTLGLWCNENLPDMDRFIKFKRINHTAFIEFSPDLQKQYRHMGIKLNTKNVPGSMVVDKGDLRLEGFSADSFHFELTNRSYVNLDHAQINKLSIMASDTSQFHSNDCIIKRVEMNVNNSEINFWSKSDRIEGFIKNNSKVWIGRNIADIHIKTDTTSSLWVN
jgi:hypothetical protein